MDQDPNAEFLRIVEGLQIQDPDVPRYAKMNDLDLSKERTRIRNRLVEADQLYDPNPTGVAAELHSQLAAINFEMKRRWRTK